MTSSRVLRRTAGFAAAALVAFQAAAALAAPQPEAGLGLPRDISAEGHRIDWLILVTNVLTSILFLIMFGWILWSATKHKDKVHEARYDHGTSKRSVMIALSMAGAVFLVVDGNLFINSTLDLENVFHNFEKVDADPNVLRVEINAHQWAWDTREPGPDGKFNTPDDIVLLNDLKIPVDTPVYFQVASVDVLHSFNLPNMRAKVDAVPGQINRLWVQAKQTGEFEIGCAQHCGTNHYKMRGVLTVLSKEDYARWAAEATKVAARAYKEDDTTAHWGWDWKQSKD